MMTAAAYYFHAALYRLCQKPVLTAMMVSSLVFAATAVTAGIAVWRVNSSCSTAPEHTLSIAGQIVMDAADRDDLFILHQAPQNGPAHSHNELSASCPCAALMDGQRARPTWLRI
jgi:hypothetical protein